MVLNDYVLIYYIHGNEPNSHEITKEGFKKGSSVEVLEEWTKENNIDDYQIYEALWVVERKYINPLKEIKRASNIAATYLNNVVRMSESTIEGKWLNE